MRGEGARDPYIPAVTMEDPSGLRGGGNSENFSNRSIPSYSGVDSKSFYSYPACVIPRMLLLPYAACWVFFFKVLPGFSSFAVMNYIDS